MLNAGFIHDELEAGMFHSIDTHAFLNYSGTKNLSIKQCIIDKHFIDFGSVLASIFKPTCEHVKNFYEKISVIPDKLRENLKLFVGYVNNRPISTAGIFFTDVAGIYDISTHPEMQNKGYGSTMFYTACNFAIDKGFKTLILQASQNGLGIYKRFGFEKICEFNVWSNKNKL